MFYLVDLTRKFRGQQSSISCFPSERDIEQLRDFLIVDEAKTRGTADARDMLTLSLSLNPLGILQ